MKICFFIGHHDAPDTVISLLDESLEHHITEFGVSQFLVGHYGAFDRMAAASVIRAKRKHPDIRLLLLLPYHPAERLVELDAGFDASFYPEGMENTPRHYAIVRANEYVIRHVCDYLIAYGKYQATKTDDFIKIAKVRERKGFLHIDNLAERVNPM